MMVTTQELRIIQFVPPSNPPLSSRTMFQSRTTSQPIPSLTSDQRTRKPAAALFPFSGGLSWAELNAMMKPGGRKPPLTINDDESDDDLPSVEQLLQIGKASRTEPAPQHLDPPAHNGIAIQADRTEPGVGERPGDSSAQPMVLDDDEPEEEGTANEPDNGAGDIEKGGIEPDTSPRSTLETSKRASNPPTKSADISGRWYDLDERRYVDWPVPDCRPRTPRDVSYSPAPDQSKILRALSVSPQDLISEQRVCETAPGSFRESGARPSNQNSNGSEDGWTQDQEAELEKELALVLVEQGNASPTSAPSPPRSRSADALLDGTPAHGLEEWEQRETSVAGETPAHQESREKELVAEGGEVEMQQQEQVRAEPSTDPSSHAQSKIIFRRPTTPINKGHHHALPRSASSSGPSSTAPCDENVLGDSGEKRGRRDPPREIGSESLHSDDSDDASDNGDADLPPAKRRKLYSPHDGHLSTYAGGEQHRISHASRKSTTAMGLGFVGEDEEMDELAMNESLQQERVMDSSDNSTDEDYSCDTTDDEDEDFRPVERSKYPTSPHMRHRAVCIPTAERNVRSKHNCQPLPEADEQLCTPQSSQSPSPSAESIPFAEYKEYAVDGVFKYTRIGNDATFNLELRVADLPEHFNCTGPLKAAVSNMLAAKVSSQAQIPSRRPAISTHHHQRQPPKRRVQSSNPPRTAQRPVTSSGVFRRKALPQRRTEWTEEEEATVVNMRKRNASWKEISVAVPSHSLGSITGHYHGTLRKRT